MRRSVKLLPLLPLLLLLLLALLAWLQYRWTGEISRAEEERMKTGLASSMRRFQDDVDEELIRVFRTFQLESPDELAESFARWHDEAPYPELVEEVFWAYPTEGGELRLQGLGPSDGALQPTAWGDALGSIRDRLEELYPGADRRRGRPLPIPIVSDAPLGVALPMMSRRSAWPGFDLSGHTIVLLSRSFVSEGLFPDLVARHFGTEEALDYDVAVFDAKGEELFVTPNADAGAITEGADAEGKLLSLRRLRGGPPPGLERGRERRPPNPRNSRRFRNLLRGTERELLDRHWKVYARHRQGSLGAAVAKARRRNLVVSFSVMGLLAASVVLMSVAARRAAELGNRKMEFVAGVSHELRTPLAVLRSAGQNLADGSVETTAQVRKYGALVERESKRLADLVEQVLALAGIQSQQRAPKRVEVSLRAIVEESLSELESVLHNEGIALETSFPGKDVLVTGDPEALRRALSNLVENAVKHGGEGKSIRVAVSQEGGDVVVTVSDDGPGIAKEDLPHLFEAFYRGERARSLQVHGSGLGLSLVDHIANEHGGRVEVDSKHGRGATFRLVLPGKEGTA